MTMAYESVSPYTDKVLESFEHVDNTQLEESLAAADECFLSWEKRSYVERPVIGDKAAALLYARVDDIASDPCEWF